MANRWIEFVRKWAAKAGISYACAVSKPECRAEYQAKYGNRKKLPMRTEREMMGAEDVRSQAVRALEKKKKIVKKKPEFIIESDSEEEYIITPKKKEKKPKRSQKAIATERVSPKLKPVMERLKMLQEDLQSQMARKKELTANLRGKLAKELKTVLDEKKRLVELSRMMGEDRDAPSASKVRTEVEKIEKKIKKVKNRPTLIIEEDEEEEVITPAPAKQADKKYSWEQPIKKFPVEVGDVLEVHYPQSKNPPFLERVEAVRPKTFTTITTDGKKTVHYNFEERKNLGKIPFEIKKRVITEENETRNYITIMIGSFGRQHVGQLPVEMITKIINILRSYLDDEDTLEEMKDDAGRRMMNPHAKKEEQDAWRWVFRRIQARITTLNEEKKKPKKKKAKKEDDLFAALVKAAPKGKVRASKDSDEEESEEEDSEEEEEEKEVSPLSVLSELPDENLKKLIRSAWKKIADRQIQGDNKKKLDERTGIQFLELFIRNKSEKAGREGQPIWRFTEEFNSDLLIENIMSELNKGKQPKEKKGEGDKLSKPFQNFSIGEEVLLPYRTNFRMLGKIINQTETGVSVKLDNYSRGYTSYEGKSLITFKRTFTGGLVRITNKQMEGSFPKMEKLPEDFDYSTYAFTDFNA
jgi:hypothetical protein